MGDVLELRGQRVVLRTTSRVDRPALVAIRRTPEVWRRWQGDDLETEFDEDLAAEESTQLTILDLDGRVVGLVQFDEQNEPDYRHARLDIYVDPSRHREGFARDALLTLIRHLFDERGHHRLSIDPVADNQAAIACYRSVGFEPVGVMRQYERQPDGTWADALLMDMVLHP